MVASSHIDIQARGRTCSCPLVQTENHKIYQADGFTLTKTEEGEIEAQYWAHSSLLGNPFFPSYLMFFTKISVSLGSPNIKNIIIYL
jgi:hypothetical protein